MINLDEIAYGNNLYFYSDEVNTSAQDFVVDVIKEKALAYSIAFGTLEEIEELDDIDELDEEDFIEEFSHEDTLGTSERLKEELFIGSEKTEESTAVRKDFNFTAKKPSFLNLKNSPIQEEELELEELLDTEQKPSYNFTMFASPKKHLEILPEADPDTIIEKNGIFTISDKVVYKDVVLDSAFKDLVDSVLNN